MTIKHICSFVPGRDQDHRLQQGGGQVFLSSGTRQGEHIVLTRIHPTYPDQSLVETKPRKKYSCKYNTIPLA